MEMLNKHPTSEYIWYCLKHFGERGFFTLSIFEVTTVLDYRPSIYHFFCTHRWHYTFNWITGCHWLPPGSQLQPHVVDCPVEFTVLRNSTLLPPVSIQVDGSDQLSIINCLLCLRLKSLYHSDHRLAQDSIRAVRAGWYCIAAYSVAFIAFFWLFYYAQN